MQEVHTGDTQQIELAIYKNGVLTNADGAVTVTVYDADDSTNTVVVTGAAVSEEPSGMYSYQLTPSVTYINRVLRVLWEYDIDSTPTNSTMFVEVVTPYATVSDIIDYYGFGTKPNDPNYKSEEMIANMERLSRTIIDNYTLQKFGKRQGSQEVFGDGSDAIWITEPMLTIDKMYENSNLVIDNTASPVFNNFGFPVELTQTNKTIRIVNAGWDIRYDNNIDPTVLYYGRFRNHSRYRFEGLIGYNYVPQDIKLCAILLVGDLLSHDAAWRTKYLKKVGMSEVTFEMSKGAFNGTGNLLVDNILDTYRNVGIVVI